MNRMPNPPRSKGTKPPGMCMIMGEVQDPRAPGMWVLDGGEQDPRALGMGA